MNKKINVVLIAVGITVAYFAAAAYIFKKVLKLSGEAEQIKSVADLIHEDASCIQ